MCINETMIITLRAVINDLESATYSDDRLAQLLAISANYVIIDTQTTVYVVDVMSPSITPDPVTRNDLVFTNLTVLRAACMIDQGNLRMRAALAGLEAVAGPTRLKVGGDAFNAYKELLNLGPCALYKKTLEDYILGSGLICHGILSPFVSNTFDASNLNNNEYREY
jgi:hypothetical protein